MGIRPCKSNWSPLITRIKTMKKHNFLALLIITVVLTAVSKVRAETNNSNSSGLSTTSYNGARNSLWDSNRVSPKPVVTPVVKPVVTPIVKPVVTPVVKQRACPGDSDCPVVKPVEIVKPEKPKVSYPKSKAPRGRG
jgi:hypothetical protein